MVVREKRTTDTWSVAEAKAKFSEVIERAREEGPQRVTKNGRDAVIVVSVDEWDNARQPTGSVLDVLRKADLGDDELVIERNRERLRDTGL
jgi:prevent-host-death family protein